jgi:hypothetical protein
VPPVEEGTDPAAGRRPQGRRRGIRTAIVLVAVFVLAMLAVVLTRPGPPVDRFTNLPAAGPDDAALLTVALDSVDASTGQLQGRTVLEPGPALPPEGARLFTDVGALPSVQVRPDQLAPETSLTLDVDAGDVGSYPFDSYRAEVQFVLVQGADATPADVGVRPTLPLTVRGVASAPGFQIEERAFERDGLGVVAIDVQRRKSVVAWVVAMMALFWLLALCAVGVTSLVVAGRRDWESRHLAWLGAMIFALVAFRNTAPGSPPIGTFLDFRAFFPAVALVALSLVALVATFLVRPRDELGL